MSRPAQDIIRWVIDRMMAHEDSITQELALTVEREARAEWGGQRVEYIAKTCEADRARRVRAAVSALASSEEPVGAVARRHGLHRATLYRMLKRDGSDGPEGAA